MKYFNGEDNMIQCDCCGHEEAGELWYDNVLYDPKWFDLRGPDLCKECAAKLKAWERDRTIRDLTKQRDDFKKADKPTEAALIQKQIRELCDEFNNEFEALKTI